MPTLKSIFGYLCQVRIFKGGSLLMKSPPAAVLCFLSLFYARLIGKVRIIAANVCIYAYRRLRWLCGLGFGGGWRRCFVRRIVFYFVDFQLIMNNNFYLLLVSVDILLFRNYNKRNNLHALVSILAYNFRTRKSIGKHPSAWFLLFYVHN
ncbi:MAG: hypothetical protein IPL33_20545 [Sphingobacteriales bacterium]|nr:hypothetical protein [Sphingobacteriales bacterium]